MASLNLGRKKILTDYKLNGNIENDKVVIPLILQEALPIHEINSANMDKYFEIYYNFMDIRNKTKTVRTDINYQVSFPNAKTTVDTINAYCFSNNPKCVSRELEKQEQIKEFNDSLNFDCSYDKLREIAFYSGICGLGYRLVLKPNEQEVAEGMYIKSVGDLNPKDCFCVYSNDVTKDKVLGVIYYNNIKHTIENGNVTDNNIVTFNVFTKWHTWLFELDNGTYNIKPFKTFIAAQEVLMNGRPYSFISIGGNVIAKEKNIPLIEYQRNQSRTNDFEQVISIMDMINRIISDSADAVSENVDYIFKMSNIDMGEFTEVVNLDGSTSLVNEVLENTKVWLKEHIMAFKGIEGSTVQPNVDILEVPLNQADVQELIAFLKSELQTHTFIPSREGGTGQDTGVAVENRNGFRSLEDVAGIITNSIISSEKEFMKIALDIASDFKVNPFKDLSIKNISIDPMRNKIINIGETFTAVATGLNCGIPPEIVFEKSNFSPDFIDTARKYEEYRKQLIAEGVTNEIARETALARIKKENTVVVNNGENSSNTK